jgi:hypothetical protein
MNWKRHIITFVIIFLVVGLLLAPRGGCPGAAPRGAARPPDARIVSLTVAGRPAAEDRLAPRSYTIRAEVADTVQKRQAGLSERRGLEPGYGMLYVYEEPRRPEFSWQYMSFPVSAAFMRGDGTIAEIHRAAPQESGVFVPADSVLYALEVRDGWFADRNLGPGDRLELPQELARPVE